ncbi:B12-binding domain-containing radical SAM protein [Geotalea uraniireducens]|uniref:B12-binding domain-containing radical SAM protein n=1 Tax=Geotalea uraniireducens TaxID=351604 RepID=A0ABM8EQ74_9BACT|nr:B12-binding domain-containing radical SAM protein [Geotalea uraniireducens]BDV44625.1 B12-binding domain-containing radical SAM protein [Geotalea uraniireducens]
MNILLVYPHSPDTFWSFRHALKFIGKKAAFPPLGLLTVAALLPSSWEKRLVDLNVRPLADRDLAWADCVFVSAMVVQRDSVLEVLERCRRLGVRTVAGGPLFTSAPADFPQVDHLVLGEAEVTLPPFLADLAAGRAGRLYAADRRADVRETPIPLWELVDPRHYAAMNVQYSRGCPFDCEFCDITQLFGRRPRTKTTAQLLAELTVLYERGWRGGIFLVDDNFIGDRRKLKEEVLPAIISWLAPRRYPFAFFTEASIDLADDPALMELMVRAGFEEVFVGIETPHEAGLRETGKVQNNNRDLLASIRRIQQAGLQVQGGFIVGFDSDPVSIFEKQIRFIQESGIATAMVGMLTALRGTKLYRRLLREGRLLGDTTGNNTAVALNFVPEMPATTLIDGYRRILTTIYAPKQYYRRVIGFLRRYRPRQPGPFRVKPGYCGAFFKSLLLLGVIGRERLQFWRLFFWSLLHRPRLLPLAITFAIYGFHFRKITENIDWRGMFDVECGERLAP